MGKNLSGRGKAYRAGVSKNSPQAWRREQSELGEGGGGRTLNFTLQAKGGGLSRGGGGNPTYVLKGSL